MVDFPVDIETGTCRTVARNAVCMASADAVHGIVRANKAFEHALGLGHGQWQGRPLEDYCHPDMPAEVLRDVWATLEAGATWAAPLKWLRRDGQALWTSTTFAPAAGAGGRPGCLVVGLHVSAAQVRAAETVYRSMRRRGLTWRDAMLQRGFAGGLS